MGCGCQKQAATAATAQSGATLGPRGRGAATGEALRSFVVEEHRVREVTGMVLPEHHRQALAQVGATDPASDAESSSLWPAAAFGGVAGLVLGQTLLAGTLGLPVAAALGALGVAAYSAGKTLPSGCSCTGSGCVTYPGGPTCSAANAQPCIDACARHGTIVGASAGVGVGLLLELWSRRFPVKRLLMGA
jgi:hypothetical protein